VVAPAVAGPKGDTGAPGPKGDTGAQGTANAASCPASNGVNGVLSNGNLTCTPFPTYAAGSGLGLTGNIFSLSPPIGLSAASTGPILSSTNSGSGPAAAFTSSGAPFTVSSSTKVGNLNADRLDGLTASDFGRAAVGAVVSYNNGGTFVEQTSVSIDAPRAGFVLVSGSAMIGTLVGGDTTCNPCLGVMRLRDKVSGALGTEQAATFGKGNGEASAQLATSWVFTVTTGPRSFTLDALTSGAPGDIFVDNPTLTALFVPFGSTGL
jgi:hypothetical protein